MMNMVKRLWKEDLLRVYTIENIRMYIADYFLINKSIPITSTVTKMLYLD